MHIVNKKIAEMLIVCLPCHFGYGIPPVPSARGTLLAVLYDTHVCIYYDKNLPVTKVE